MNAMIFAAGLGTRLIPYTHSMPKALVPVNGIPMLEYALMHLHGQGARFVVVNVHHFADQIRTYLQQHEWPGMTVVCSDETDQLLDTGGGLVKALPLFPNRAPVVVVNADVLCNVPLGRLFRAHQAKKSMATLLTRVRPSTRQLLWNGAGQLCGWVNHETNQWKWVNGSVAEYREQAFCGVHCIEQELIGCMGPARPFPVMEAYLQLAALHPIGHSELPPDCYWFDVGTPAKLALATEFLQQHKK